MCMCMCIQALLGAPNPDDPLANDVAQRWKEDEPAAIQTGMFTPYSRACTRAVAEEKKEPY